MNNSKHPEIMKRLNDNNWNLKIARVVLAKHIQEETFSFSYLWTAVASVVLIISLSLYSVYHNTNSSIVTDEIYLTAANNYVSTNIITDLSLLLE